MKTSGNTFDIVHFQPLISAQRSLKVKLEVAPLLKLFSGLSSTTLPSFMLLWKIPRFHIIITDTNLPDYGARWRGKVPVPVLHALGWKCVGVWSITMVATHLPQKVCDAHMISFTRPSSHLTNSFFPASKIVIAEESEREGLGTRLLKWQNGRRKKKN